VALFVRRRTRRLPKIAKIAILGGASIGAAALTLAGAAPTLVFSGTAVMPSASLALTGQTVGVAFAPPTTGSVALTGAAPTLVNLGASTTIAVPAGTLTLTAQTPDSIVATSGRIQFRASLFSTTNTTSYATGTTYTPAANSLLVACVATSATSGVVAPPTVTGHGVSWSAVPLAANTLSTTHRIDVYIANAGASPTSAAFTVSGFSSNRTGAAIVEYEVTGVSFSAGLAATIVQQPTNTSTGTTGTVTLAAASDIRNLPISFFLHLANETSTGRTNWVVATGAVGNYNTPATGAIGQYRNDAFETTASATWSTSSAWRGVALEVAAQSGIQEPGGTLTLSGLAPLLKVSGPIPAGSIALTGRAATVNAGPQSGALPAGALTLTGKDVGVAFKPPTTGAITVTGQAPTVSAAPPLPGSTIVIPAGSLTLSGTHFEGILFNGPETGSLSLVGSGGPLSPPPITPPAGAITLTGRAPVHAKGIGLPVGTLTLTGRAANLAHRIGIPAGSLTLVGQAGTHGRGLAVPVGSLILTGQAPVTGVQGTIPIPAGAIRFTELAPILFNTSPTPIPAGSIALTGNAPALAWTTYPPAGTITLTGLVASPTKQSENPSGAISLLGQPPLLAHRIAMGLGALTLTGRAMPDVPVRMPAGAITLTGRALGHARTITPGTGGIALTGQTHAHGRGLGIPVGTLTLTGLQVQPVTGASVLISPQFGALTCTGLVLTPAWTRPVPAGSITLTGSTPAGPQNIPLALPAGSLTLTGRAPNFAVTITLGVGAITLTGQVPQPVNGVSPILSSQNAVLALTGRAPALLHQIGMNVGTITLTGLAPLRIDAGTRAVPAGAITLTGLAPALSIDGRPAIPAGSLTLTGQAPTLAFTIAIPAGTLTGTGLTAFPVQGTAVTIGVFNTDLVLTGYAPTLVAMTQQTGAELVLTGQPASLAFAVDVPCGSVVLTGEAPDAGQISQVRAIPAGTITLTGYPPTLTGPGIGLFFRRTLTHRVGSRPHGGHGGHD
jgi:hypothetical protein